MTTAQPRKHFTLPLQPTPADARGYVMVDLSNQDDPAQTIVCAVCKLVYEGEGFSQIHETPVGPADRCRRCSGLFRGSEPTVT